MPSRSDRPTLPSFQIGDAKMFKGFWLSMAIIVGGMLGLPVLFLAAV